MSKQAGTASRWRVVLVGRTGLDQALRRVRSVELIRARDTFDAIGELSDPIDASSPMQAAVIVARGLLNDDAEREGFVHALRLVDPKVRVLGVDDGGSLDGVVDAHAGGDEILHAIESSAPRSLVVVREVEDVQAKTVVAESIEAAPAIEKIEEHAPSADETDAAAPEQESDAHQWAVSTTSSESHRPIRTPAHAPMNDQKVIEALTSGRPITPTALDLIRARVGRDDIDFVQGAADSGCAVRLGRSAVGTLVCADERWVQGSGSEELSIHAAWLGRWLKLEAQHSELREAAFTDSLTGAWNRRYFNRFIDAAIEQSRAARQPLTVLYFDIDGFKQYNDRYGHAAGDEILVETVRLMQSVIRPSDRVCRVGGDEFVVIFYEPHGPRDPSSKPPESIYGIATRFQQQICTHEFPKLGAEARSTLTISGGLASFPWDGADAESLLERADQLAMDSKRQGKNAITLGPGAESVCRIKPGD